MLIEEMFELTPHLARELITALGSLAAIVCCIVFINEIRKG
jgi:hypothetical protein